MQTLLKTKIGPFLVVSSVLAAWMLLAAQPVQAHSLTDPSCSSLPNDDFFDDQTDLTSVSPSTNSPDSTKPGTGESGGGRTAHYYAKITVPALTAGELTVFDGTAASATYSSEAILCGRREGNVSSRPSYASAHISADSAATTATTAQTAAQNNNTASGESTARTALIRAANALATYNSSGALTGGIAYALTRAEETQAANAAIEDSDDARVAGGQDAKADGDSRTGAVEDDLTTQEDPALGDAATALRVAAHALDPNIGFNIDTLISSGDEEYVVVVTVPADANAPSLSVDFKGVMSTTAEDSDEGFFAENNQQDPYALTTNTPGLLTVRTTGSAVDTIGTLNGAAMDDNSGSNNNFQIVSPVDTGAHTVSVKGRPRGARGDYTLALDFKVASIDNDALGTGTTIATEMLERGRADYFFFTVPDDDYLFLTVQTQKHMDVTTATNTTGTLFSQKGLVATDTDTGAGTNFLLRAPISVGDYIVEVKGASSSTAGAYVLVTSSNEATSWGSAPDMIVAGTSMALALREAKPFSITVDKPGTLQVKTTGSTDTVGVLYGPTGQQLATDDNSGADKNFRITQQVEAGQHIVTVEEQEGKVVDTGDYDLVVNFIEDLSVGSEDRVAELERERDNLQTERNTCQTSLTQLERDTAPVTVDATGFLENPSGVRSGVGLISGWVCAANDVEIRISAGNSRVATLDAAYGTTRADTVDSCQHGEDDTGFGMTYNFNHLDEGMYTIEAYADGRTRIGSDLTFEVVHLVDFPASDTDRFLRNLDGMCSVPDFPAAGDTTMLEWEQSIQNFVISDVQ